MYAPRVLAFLAAGIALCAALPAQNEDEKPVPRPITTIMDDDLNDSWFGFPFFGNLFGPLWRLFPSFSDIGPKIVADDDKFQVNIRVKDYTKEELKVKVKNDFIFIQGTHEAKHEDHDIFASQFFHTYTLPTNSSADDVKAELSSDGWLTVTAPISTGGAENSKNAERVVDIVETGTPYSPPKKSDLPTDATPKPNSPAATETEDRREPTTVPADREEVTEKDNNIYHGNDVVPL